MKSIPIYDASAPVTCTIGRDEVAGRVALIERMRTAMSRIERSEHGMLLYFPNRRNIEVDLQTFAVDEKRCCEFWGFAVTSTPDELVLRWDGPPTADDLVDRLFAYFEGDEPLTTISGLL